VLTSTGEVVTNHHAVEGSTSLTATVMSTGRTYAATVIGTDAKDDVAVIRLTGASGLDTVTPDTDGASVGDAVTAVGDANGTASHFSAAGGTVTRLNDSITTRSEGPAAAERLTGLMKISSDVISGDSGGATYDADGEVVGMTTAASVGGSQIDGYAVPIDKVLSIVDDLDRGVTSSRYVYDRPAFLGIGLTAGESTVAGVYEGTPATRAGIAAGDRITAVGATEVSTSAQLQAVIARLAPGDKVSITWTGGGRSQTRTVTLATGGVE
jgi:S1-C subfamily serine protease